ncbi:flavoprotein [Tissierella praeacuta]|uniref:flavoprotein n=1 Tax=Tissierella praeacuta TaxID=43131 RepID=UPI0035196835
MKTKITSKVLEDISKRLQGEGSLEDGDKALVVFNGSDIGLDEKIKNIKKLKDEGIKISLAFSFMAEQMLDTQRIISSLCPINIYKEQDIFKLKNISMKYSMIIGVNITMNTLSKISLGMIDSFIPNLIWTFLYRGKKVYLDFSSVRNYLGEETKNKVILEQVNKHINTLKNMGAVEIDNKTLLENITKGMGNLQININKELQHKDNKTVITEKDIISMSSNNKLILPKRTIITPLAKDKAREKNIKIEIK